MTRIEVVTEPTATLEVTAKTKWGKPVEGATVYLNPNVLRMQTGIFGQVRVSNEEPFRKPVALPHIPYSATTDKNGSADRKSTRLNSRPLGISYSVFCLEKTRASKKQVLRSAQDDNSGKGVCGSDPRRFDTLPAFLLTHSGLQHSGHDHRKRSDESGSARRHRRAIRAHRLAHLRRLARSR